MPMSPRAAARKNDDHGTRARSNKFPASNPFPLSACSNNMLQSSPLRCRSLIKTKRCLSTTSIHYDKPLESHATNGQAALNPKWLTDIKARIGKCLAFGVPAPLVDEAGKMLEELGRDWRDLVAGSEGFVTDPQRAGLHRHEIYWGDQDTMGHVNNVMYVRYAESGRVNWTRNYGKHFDVPNRQKWNNLLTNKGFGLILKSITVDYKFPMTWPDKISVYHKLRSRPTETTESMLLDVMILSELRQRPAARCLEDVVVYHYPTEKKSPLAPFMLEQFRETFELQEKAKAENQAKIRRIEQQVRSLEQQSWDRPEAKEDFGTS
jgi:acyl-CoA thioesterase FadM